MNWFIATITLLYVCATVTYALNRQWPDTLMCAGSVVFSIGLLVNGMRA